MRYSIYPLLLQLPKCIYVYHMECRHKMIQIIPNYLLFECNKNEDLFHYNTIYRRNFKNDIYMKNMVNNYHIVPNKFKNNSLIRSLYVDV